MSLTMERIPNEPIIIATITGATTVADARTMFAASVDMLDEMGLERVWRITDVSHIEATFTDLFMILAEATKKHIPGSPADPRFDGMLVGSNQLVKLYAKAVQDQRYGHLRIPVFPTREDALNYIHEQIAAQQQQD